MRRVISIKLQRKNVAEIKLRHR